MSIFPLEPFPPVFGLYVLTEGVPTSKMPAPPPPAPYPAASAFFPFALSPVVPPFPPAPYLFNVPPFPPALNLLFALLPFIPSSPFVPWMQQFVVRLAVHQIYVKV